MHEEVKAYLWGYRNAKKDYIRAKLELEECETAITNISVDYSKEKVQSTPNDRLADAIHRLDILRANLIDATERAVEKMEEVHFTIEQIDDSTLKDLLTRYYLLGQTWEKIAFETNCSWTGVHKRHARALYQVKKLL